MRTLFPLHSLDFPTLPRSTMRRLPLPFRPRPAHLLVFAFALSSCDLNGSDSIARTDGEGNIIEDDSGDWNPRCTDSNEGETCALPAYPNPVVSGVEDCPTCYEFMLPVGLAQASVVRIVARRDTAIQVLVDGVYAAGRYPIQILLPASSPNGLYRVTLEVEGERIRGDVLLDVPSR